MSCLTRMARFMGWIAVFAIFVASPSLDAACTDLSKPACMTTELQDADQQLNALYTRVVERTPEDRKAQLRAEQRKWIQERNIACKLQPGSTSGSDWIARLTGDPGKAMCVYGSTHQRIEQLRNSASLNSAIPLDLLERHETSFPVSHNSGKWYAEVTFFAKGYNREGNEYMQVGATNGKSLVGMQAYRKDMSREATSEGNYIVGIALDMDNGRMYWSSNGTWHGAPGSAEGAVLERGESYTMRVISSGPEISTPLDRGGLVLNAGQKPFMYPMPAGFQPFYAPPANVAEGSRLAWIVPSYKKVAGLGLPQWAEKYWAWFLATPPERSPVQDTTGKVCADGQSGPVWFLAGGDAKSHITRGCTVPRGKFILLPALAQIMFPKDGAQLCDKLEKDGVGRAGSEAIKSAWVVVDGERFDALYDYRSHTTACTAIRGSAGETVVSDAMFYGVWVLLQPLTEGEHTISFGGELPAMNLDRSVTYRIRVD